MIHIGTSSWLFDGWRGVFYPQELPRGDSLAWYVTQFDTVEVNTSFYALPRASVVVDWVDTAPPGFTFALKAPREITHDRKLVGVEDATNAFVDAVASMGDAAGPVLFQFPPEFSRKKYGRQLADWLTWLAPRRLGQRVAIEVRAADLMTEAFSTWVAGLGYALVLVDRVGTPDCFPLWEQVVQAGKAPGFVYVRLIGDDRHGPAGDAVVQSPRSGQLAQWADRLRWLDEQGQECFVYVHNPFEGHSPASVRTLREMLGDRVAPWPPAGHSGDGAPGQMPLF